MKLKEESEKVGFKLNIQKTKIMASSPITSWQIDGETVETVADFIFGGSKITADGDCSREIRIDAFELWCWRILLRVPWMQCDLTSPFWRRSALGFLWKEWCWSWSSTTLATSCEELTHWKILWCWEGLGAGVEGDDRGWDRWMASLTWWTWVWVNSGSWWWTWRPGVLRFMGLQRVGHDWVTDLIWSDT